MKNFILSNKIKVDNNIIEKKGHYLYFLIQKDKIVYVGRTAKLSRRIRQHSYNKKFDYYFYFTISNFNRLQDKEQKYIKLFNPKYNDNPPKIKPKYTRYCKKCGHFEYTRNEEKFLKSLPADVKTIQKKLGISRSAVYLIIENLIDGGLKIVSFRQDGKKYWERIGE